MAGYNLDYVEPEVRARHYQAQIEQEATLSNTQRYFRTGYISCLDDYATSAKLEALSKVKHPPCTSRTRLYFAELRLRKFLMPEAPQVKARRYAEELRAGHFIGENEDGVFQPRKLAPRDVAFRAGYMQCMADKAEAWRRATAN